MADGLDTDDAVSHGEDDLAQGAEATGQDVVTGEAEGEEPEAEAGAEGEGGEGEEPAAGAEEPGSDELTLLKQRLAELEPLAQIGQRFLAQPQTPAPQQAQQPQGLDPRVDQALRVAHDPKKFEAFPLEVQIEAGRLLREAEEDQILRITNPAAWRERHLAPTVRQMLAPVAARFAKREFLLQNPDLATPEDEQAVADEIGRGTPVHAAAELVRLRKAAAGQNRVEQGARARQADAEALKQARRGRATSPKSTARGTSPKHTGWRAEDVLGDLESAGALEE